MPTSRIMLVTALALSLGACAETVPDRPYRTHPHYLHALSDLRMARAFLNQGASPNLTQDQSVAIEEINQAIREIRRASIDDGKDPNFSPPVDAPPEYRGRLRKALELVSEARGDLGHEEDSRAALKWRAAAIHHVNEASASIERAIDDRRMDQGR